MFQCVPTATAVTSIFVTARSELHKVAFGAVSLWFFLFMYEISREPLNRFARSSHGPCSHEFEVHQHFSALTAACMQFMSGKTSLASSLIFV